MPTAPTEITLAPHWEIPSYVQNHLWVETETEVAQSTGMHGHISTTTSPNILLLRWGSATGAPLNQFSYQQGMVDWRGEVRLAGDPDSIHALELADLDITLAIILFSGQPLQAHTQPYPPASERAALETYETDYWHGVNSDIPAGLTSWIADAESPLVSLLQEAMMNRHQVYVFGRLAPEHLGYHYRFALPILLEAVTVFGR